VIRASGDRTRPSGPRPLGIFGANQFRDLSDVAEIMKRPLVQHLGERDLAELLAECDPVPCAVRQMAKKVEVALALILEVIESLL
jgi:hypothetical protein